MRLFLGRDIIHTVYHFLMHHFKTYGRIPLQIAGSSNGRTSPSGGEYWGSSP